MSRVWDRTPKEKASSLRPFGGEILPIEQRDCEYFLKRYELDVSVSSRYIKLAPASNRYALPVIAPEGWVRGMVLRKPWPKAPREAIEPIYWVKGEPLPFDLPKADTYMSRYEPVQSFYRAEFGEHASLVIVEDQLSAIKLANHGYDSAAILGTPYSKGGGFQFSDRVAELARVANGREVVIAFDADATDAAFEFAKKWGPSFRRSHVAIMDRDIKDTPSTEFREVLGV